MTTQTATAGEYSFTYGEPVLEIKNLTKHFAVGNALRPKHVRALNDASFTIHKGEVVALVGESGSGKSTTARLITRLVEPTRGQILLHGRNVLETERRHASRGFRKSVQMIFQDPFGSLNPVQTIGQHIELSLKLHKMAKGKEVHERVLELLSSVGLNPPGEVARRYPYQLSGGMRQRVAIARALAVEPEVILADEPISMLDVSIRLGVLNLMESLKANRGIGFLYITHDLASARYIGDRTIVMYAGHMVEGAESTELMSEPAHPYTRLLLSAVPNPQSGLTNTNKEGQAKGEIPSLIDPPTGCPFAARCPHVTEICRTVMPGCQYINAGTDHWVRCHLYGPGEGKDGPKTPAMMSKNPAQTPNQR